MNMREKIEQLAQNNEDRILLAKVFDKLSAGNRKNIPAYTAFLSLREQDLVRRLLGETSVTFYGGFLGAERSIACYLPDYYCEEDLSREDGPIVCIRASYYEKDRLSHRDFLGSLMGAGIKRETVGDICVGVGQTDFFVTKEISPYVLQNLVSASRTKLHLERIPLSEAAIPLPETAEITDTLPSMRLDCVLGAGFRISRNLAVQHILAGGVAINGLPCEKPDRTVSEGSSISARGLGKIRLSSIKGLTKKGRYSVVIEKYI